MEIPQPLNGTAVGYIVPQGFVISQGSLRKIYGTRYSALLRALTSIYEPKIGAPVITRLYDECTVNGTKCLRLPRAFHQQMVDEGIITVRAGLGAPNKIAAVESTLYENQKILCDWLMANIFTAPRISAGSATCILNLRAGMGKTFVAAGLIAALQMRTLYIVPKRPLAVQTVKDLKLCVGSDKITIGQYVRGKPLYDVTVIVINSALKTDLSAFSLVIMDEVHMYNSECRRAIFHTMAPCVLGMTATSEDRSDQLDIIATTSLAGDGIIRAENIPGFTYEDIEYDLRVRVIKYNGPPEHTRNLCHEVTDMLFTHYMYEQFFRDPHRIGLICAEIIALYEAGHRLYVFAEEIKCLNIAHEAIIAALNAAGRADIVNAAVHELRLFTGGLKDHEISDIVATSRILFSTYSYAGTGISIVDMTAMIFVTPRRANMKQIMARIMRRGSDLSIPRIVVDIVDNCTALRGQLSSRMEAYYFYGAKIEYCKKDYRQN